MLQICFHVGWTARNIQPGSRVWQQVFLASSDFTQFMGTAMVIGYRWSTDIGAGHQPTAWKGGRNQPPVR